MCRMIAFVGSVDVDLSRIFSTFRAGSECDPYAAAAFGPKHTCHPDGWGYAIYDGVHLHHFRSSRPVWQEEFKLPPIQGPNVYAVFHSRLASNPSLNAPVASHPFVAAGDSEILLLAHNGGVETDASAPKDMVDSEWALGAIAKAGSLEKALPQLKERTKHNSALNLMVLAIPRDQTLPPAVHCLNFFKTEVPERIAYYTMYTADLGGGKVFFSSTFKDLGFKGLTDLKRAPFDQLFSLRLHPPVGSPKTRSADRQSIST
jgi:predicted glutamine amidotransferase